MSRDDEVAVVFRDGKYYVGWVGGGNISYVFSSGASAFDDVKDAIEHARFIDRINGGTEYGVRIYY